MNYWLMKSEPSTFSIDDLRARPRGTEPWEGVRNYQVRNMLRDNFQVGDLAFFYHSSCTPPGIVGTMEIVKQGYPDISALDPESPYYDPRSSKENPIWFRVDVKFKEKFNTMITLDILKQIPELAELPIVRKGNRLSIVPLTKKMWQRIVALA